jgi:hypothetical protein
MVPRRISLPVTGLHNIYYEGGATEDDEDDAA